MKLAASRELHAYWTLLRGARAAPERSEIEPSEIRGVLSDTFILEVSAPERYPIRVAGTRTNALFMRELRSRPFLDLWREQDQPEVAAMLASVSDEALGVVAGVLTGPPGLRPAELELLLLPLRHHGDTHARVLGSCAPASLPSWIGLAPAAPMRLLSMRVLERDERIYHDARTPAANALASANAFSRAPHWDRRGHLFVVTDAPSPR